MSFSFQRLFSLSFLVLALLLSANEWPAEAQKPEKEKHELKFGDPLPANAFVELAKLANPSVVTISTSTVPRRPRGFGRDPLMDMLEQMYGFSPMPQNVQPMHGLGSGFLIRESGMILTNNHVVAGADQIMVHLSSRGEKQFSAKVVGSDERTDIALIKIDGKDF
ncbi:MAG: serine protease MucD, partial [Bdellovibrio sp.]